MLSFLTRKDDNPLLGNPVASYYQGTFGQTYPQQSKTQSTTQQQTTQTSAPYPIQTLADGRVKYSDGTIKGTPKNTPAPTYTPPPKQESPSVENYVTNYVDSRAKTAQDRVGQVNTQLQNNQDLQKQLYESRNKTLGNIGDISTNSFNTYADQLRSGLGIQQGTANRQIDTAKAENLDQRYYNEQARKERMKGLENTLASLGTLQSSAMGNIGAKINMGAERQDRTAQRDLNNRIADIQDSYRVAENQVETLIQQEAGNFRKQMAALAGELDTNSIEYRMAASQLADNANATINSILDNFDQFAYSAGLELIKAQAAGGDQLSSDFLTTGQPQTRADYTWIANNPDKYQTAYGDVLPEQISPQEAEERQRSINLVDELLNKDLGAVSGLYGRSGLGTLSGPGADTKAAINQLIGRLTVDERGKLKGQGQISDRETQMLQDSVTRLTTPGLSQDAIKQELMRIKSVLSGEAAQPYKRPSLQSMIEP